MTVTLTEIIDGAVFTFVFDQSGQLVKLRRNGVDFTDNGNMEHHAFQRLEEMGVNMQEKLSIALMNAQDVG